PLIGLLRNSATLSPIMIKKHTLTTEIRTVFLKAVWTIGLKIAFA
ncbi:unnamed protein product, partial [marine sediment metagenome]